MKYNGGKVALYMVCIKDFESRASAIHDYDKTVIMNLILNGEDESQ